MIKAAYFSRFLPSTEKGGGCRRMLQLEEIFRTVLPNLELVAIFRGDWLTDEQRDRLLSKSSYRFSRSTKWSSQTQDRVYRFNKISKIWAGFSGKLAGLQLAILDDPIYFFPLFKKLKRMQIPVIAVCHNLESLVPSQVRRRAGKVTDLLIEELEILAQCEMVITISREEDVLLRNLGLESFFLPYYPVQAIRTRLSAIREQRKHTAKKDILTVGTLQNPATREGIIHVADYWLNHLSGKCDTQLIIGGYFSKTYEHAVPTGRGITFKGTLSDQELDEIMAKVKACLCYQQNGSGALTRICEMLLAGIPVLANTHAARSYYNLKGLFEFQELHELAAALRNFDSCDAVAPLPDAPDSSRLCAKINQLLGSKR